MSDFHPTRIYLTGFMGSGKSTSGPHLARRMGYRFVDIDRQVEAAKGMSVARIFSELGETTFRALEREAVLRTLTEERVVVSLGGGVVADPELRDRLVGSGILVWLRVEPDVLAERLARSASRRPLLWDETGMALTGDALVARIRTLLERRVDAYSAAQVTVDADSTSARETARKIHQALMWMG